MSGDDDINDLPVVLVSAADVASADNIISELIDNEVVAEGGEGRVWELSNKYYTARVRLQPAVGPGPGLDRQPEAHVIYLAENECTEAALRGRVLAGECGVRLALCAPPPPLSPALRRAAALLRYELVPLSAADSDDSDAGAGEGPFPSLRGVARAREALHAHTWPSLRMRAAAPPPPPPRDHEFKPFQSYQNGVDSALSDSECEGEEGVSRAELFAEALSAVAGVRGAARGAGRGERVARAEGLLAAVARALGTDIHHL